MTVNSMKVYSNDYKIQKKKSHLVCSYQLYIIYLCICLKFKLNFFNLCALLLFMFSFSWTCGLNQKEKKEKKFNEGCSIILDDQSWIEIRTYIFTVNWSASRLNFIFYSIFVLLILFNLFYYYYFFLHRWQFF